MSYVSKGPVRGPGAPLAPGYGAAVGPNHLLLLAAAAASPVAPPNASAPIEATAEGAVLVGSVAGAGRSRYRILVPHKGTVLIAIEPIHGPVPLAVLRNAEGQRIRRADRRGRLWARPPAASELLLELSSVARDARSVFQLSVAFDIDRPRALRGQRRPARPRDIVGVSAADPRGLDRVLVGGLVAEHTIQGGEVYVSVPAFAQRGPIELHYEARPPEVVDVELIGVEPPRADLDTGACTAASGTAPPGCLRLLIEPSVGSRWLDAIAREVDADLVKHQPASGAVVLKLRLPSSEGYALEQLRAMPGIKTAQPMATATR